MQKTGFSNLRQFIAELRKQGEIIDVYHEVDSNLEIAEIHRRVAAANGPALFFHNVKNSTFPLVSNLFGSIKRVEIAFNNRPDALIKDLIALATNEFPPSLSCLWKKRSSLKSILQIGIKKQSRSPILEQKMTEVDLEKLPFLKTWPLDGGHFVTLPLVYTEPVVKGPPNLGMYRIQRYTKNQTGLHFQIAKGSGFHYHQAEQLNQELPVNIFIGGPPALILSAITPLPENVSELLLCSLLQGKKLDVTHISNHPYPLISECEFALVGAAKPHVRKPEGPFGDHYGYYSWQHDFPVFDCQAIYHRKDAIYPATVVGKPRQEDFYIGNYLQDLLSPIFPIVMPGVKSLWSYGEAGFHSLSAAIVKERYYRECMASAFRILGEGQLALTKFLIVTDQDVDLKNFKSLLKTVLERFSPQTDLFIFSQLSLDTLDYTGPELNKGSRGVLLGIGSKKRDLPETFSGTLPTCVRDVAVFTAGCLVLEVPNFETFKDYDAINSHTSFTHWPMLILVDNIKKALKSVDSFMWTVFTRFEPAADIHFNSFKIVRHHLCYQGPMLIDARMKPSYPPEVLCDNDTDNLVSKNWLRYFPQGLEMGDSIDAHV